ncbi:MAG: 2-oxoglutarate dehydrogenase E2 component (dihydrolipoamide succinyltransferase) [Gammaproteobacteria bacterium]
MCDIIPKEKNVAIEVKVPVLAESVAEANLLSWHKKVGDFVKRGDNLIDIETDKVTLEVAAPNNGVLIEILKQDGEDVESDEIIAIIDTEKKAAVEETTPVAAAAEDAPQQQTLLEPEPETAPQPAASKQPVFTSIEEVPKLSPAVRNLLAENKLETSDIKTQNDPDRITKEDVLNHLAGAINDNASVKSAAEPRTVVPKTAAMEEQSKKAEAAPVTTIRTEQRPEERVAMTRLRKRAAERLLSAQHDNALLTTFNEVNMQAVMDLRQRYKKEFEETHESKLGFMSFFTKAAVEALKKFPVINASVDGEDILYRGYFDIGIAVSSKRGLVVPVLRDADTLSFAGIESKITELGKKAGEGKLTIEELTGGTFTLTNGGTFGSLLSTPIINPPQSAILGMHKIQERPVAENGQVVIRPMMYLALSYDHRIIDGREAVQFLVAVKEQIEDPTRLLLQI